MRRFKINTLSPQAVEAHELAVQLFKDIYQETEMWPRPEAFALIMDIRRSAMNLSSNLGEVHKHSWDEFLEFLILSQDSLSEIKDQLIAARKKPELVQANLEKLLQQVETLTDRLQKLRAT